MNWSEANQRRLMAALLPVREALEGHARLSPPAVEPIAPPPALETLCALFGLSSFERDLLLLCAGVELDSSFGALCAAAQGDSRCDYPTFNIAGGNIRNVALRAAFLAADAGEPVRMEHLLRASHGEYAKLEKPLTDAETGGWV